MSEQKWTDGKWSFAREGDDLLIVTNGAYGVYEIANLGTRGEYEEGEPGEHSLADGNLFLAAPALYEALSTLANLGDANIGADVRKALRPHERDSFDAAIAAARAALSQAGSKSNG